MPSHARCVVGVCDNDKRYPERMIKHSNVKEELVMHKLPVNEEKRAAWIHQVSKGRQDFVVPKNFYVCSNHFIDGKPTKENPNPTLFMTISTNTQSTPRKRKRPTPRTSLYSERFASTTDSPPEDFEDDECEMLVNDKSTLTEEYTEVVPMRFCQLTKESDVRFFTGFESSLMFETVFDHLKLKASVMSYWDGAKKSLVPKNSSSTNLLENILSSPDYDIDPSLVVLKKSGPQRKLSLEQEFLLVMMKLRLGSMVEDLAFRFQISAGKVSQIFITWMKFLSKELSVLIIWPSANQIKATLPICYKKLYPKVRVVIDCTEVFVETPSSLDVQACLWSDYKQHCTFKFLVCITPNGAISWLSPVYGGRASDIFIVRDSGFLQILERKDQVMADRGFKIKTDLAMKQCSLCIPPSAAKGNQMTSSDVKKTKNIANVRIFVEQAIGRMKEYHILKTKQPLMYLPIFNDIVRVIGAFVNLKRPLAM